MCCGWAIPIAKGDGFETKICQKPELTVYINKAEQEFSFSCDPKIEKMNMNAEDYAARFWKNMKKDGPMNIPGYGPSRPFVAPI